MLEARLSLALLPRAGAASPGESLRTARCTVPNTAKEKDLWNQGSILQELHH